MMGGEKDVPDLQVRLPLHTRPHDCLCIPDHRACQPHWVRLPLHTRPQGVQSPRGQVKIPKKDCVLRPHIDIQVRWSLLCYFADLYYNNIWGDPPRRCVLCVVCCVLCVVCWVLCVACRVALAWHHCKHGHAAHTVTGFEDGQGSPEYIAVHAHSLRPRVRPVCAQLVVCVLAVVAYTCHLHIVCSRCGA